MIELTELQQAKARIVQLTEVLGQHAVTQHMAYHRQAQPEWDTDFLHCPHQMCQTVRQLLSEDTYTTEPQSAGATGVKGSQVVNLAKDLARALSLEGTCTGEHGVGLHKMGFLADEAGLAWATAIVSVVLFAFAASFLRYLRP